MSASPAGLPLIVRVAGLEAGFVDAFSHEPLLEVLAEQQRLQQSLDQKRAALVECLHGAVSREDREERRFFLSVKRRCFNAGSLRAHREDPRWPLLAAVASPLLEAVVALEGAIESIQGAFEDLYRDALREERQSLVRLLEHPPFLRGVALASPVVAQNLHHLQGVDCKDFGRREKRLSLTLLRYASRAALKLSPFSTLTRAALGTAIETDAGGGGFRFAPGGSWREKSTISLHRELLAQCACLLLRSSQFAGRLQVRLNETLTAEGGERYSFFRPGRWEFDEENRAFRHSEASSVKVGLEGPLIAWLITELSEGPQTYRGLLDRARALFDAEGEGLADESLTALLDLEFLSLILPWDFSAPDLERRILDHLDALPAGPELDAFRNRLRELNRFLSGYPETGAPARFLEESQHGVEGLFQALAPPANLPPGTDFKASAYNFEEIVFLGEVGSVPRPVMLGLLEDLDPLVRLSNLHSTTHDFLRTLAALGERRWPGSREIGLLELFHGAQPLFDQYLRYRTRSLHPAFVAPGFNPLEIESVRDLTGWRQRVEKELGACFHGDGDVQRLCPRSLGSLLDQVPSGYAGSRDFCAFLQPFGADGRGWVLNAVAEGYGRYGSRFSTGMDEEARERWTSCFSDRSVFDLDGEPVELVDISCPGTRSINVHAAQTRRVLQMPGDFSSLPPERLLRLRGLRVRFRGADRAPVLTDAAGQRLLPVSLGSLAPRRRPALLKFIAVFGPGEFNPRHPVRGPRPNGEVEAIDRHVLGEVVYSRKKWRLRPASLLAALEGLDEAHAFAAIHRWRLAKGLPRRIFAREAVAGPNSRAKPQYIDLSSPSFTRIFRSILCGNPESLVVEEALPVPEQFPLRAGPWGVEVQLESFVFRPQIACPPAICEGDQRSHHEMGATRKE